MNIHCSTELSKIKIGFNFFKNTQKVDMKGTVSVITSDPPCKDGNVRFITVPLKALFIIFENEYFLLGFLYKSD